MIMFVYETVLGRLLLKILMKSRADRLAAWFLRTKASRPLIGPYVKRHGIDISSHEKACSGSFGEFFAREETRRDHDMCPDHLISPCDGWLSAFDVRYDSTFEIKGSVYRISDLVKDEKAAERFERGTCLVIRLCASDYHHYCFIDDGTQQENHFIPGELHSVQPAALERYPVFRLNRRSWCIMETEHFGRVIQTEIGAFIVGGIVNEKENASFRKGEEKGHFELSGSTIVLFFEEGKVKLLPGPAYGTPDNEFRVRQGMWIGTSVSR